MQNKQNKQDKQKQNKLAEKVVALDLDHDLGLRRGEVNKIVATLKRQKASYKSDEEWLSAIQSMTDNLRVNPLKEEIRKSEVAVSQLCPVCGSVAQPITLMRGRKAYYCNQHRAVSPAMANEDE